MVAPFFLSLHILFIDLFNRSLVLVLSYLSQISFAFSWLFPTGMVFRFVNACYWLAEIVNLFIAKNILMVKNLAQIKVLASWLARELRAFLQLLRTLLFNIADGLASNATWLSDYLQYFLLVLHYCSTILFNT